MKKIIYSILFCLAIPGMSNAAYYSVSMVATSTVQGWAFGAPLNGLYQSIVAPTFIATSTTASSTFYNGIQITSGCFQLPSGSCAGASGGTSISTTPNMVLVSNSSGNNAISSGTPAVTAINATSTTATSTFNGGLIAGGTLGLTVPLSSGNVSIGGIPLGNADLTIRNNGSIDSAIDIIQPNNHPWGLRFLNTGFSTNLDNAFAFYQDTTGNTFFYLNGTGAPRWTFTTGGSLGIGTSTPSKLLSVAGDIYLTGDIFDSTGSFGTNGMVLQTTGSTLKWVATSSLNITGGSGSPGGSSGQIQYNSAGMFAGTSSPTANYFTATSTTPSQFPNASTTQLSISQLFDSANSLGTNGQVLKSSGSTSSWVSTSSLNIVQTSLMSLPLPTVPGSTNPSTMSFSSGSSTMNIGTVYFPENININQITIKTVTVATSGPLVLGVYDLSGNLVLSTTTQNVTSTVIVTSTTTSTFFLQAGIYYLAILETGITNAQVLGFNTSGYASSFSPGGKPPLEGTYTVPSLGVMPASITLSSVSISANKTPVIRFDN